MSTMLFHGGRIVLENLKSSSIVFYCTLTMHCLSSDVELSRPYDETDDVLIEVLEPLAGSKRLLGYVE